MLTTLYTGIETPDGVLVTIASGQALRMHVWIDRSRRTVESRLVRVQDDGAEVQVFRRVVHTVTEQYGPDCLKVVASGSVIVAHWFEGDLESVGGSDVPANPAIRRYTIDLELLESAQWTDRGTNAVVRFQHDLQPVQGHASDFIMAYISTGDVCRVRRYNGLSWIDIDWDEEANDGFPVAPRCISCYAHEGDGDALVTFEPTLLITANQVWTTRFAASSGAGAATLRSFLALPPVYLHQATHARYGSRNVALLVDCAVIDESLDHAIPLVAGVRLSSQTAAPTTDEHAWYHLRLLGQAFSFAGARADDTNPNVYALVGYQDAEREFGQSAAWVVNVAAGDWNSGGDDNTVRPRCVANFTLGDIDSRVSGANPDGDGVPGFATGRRCGHLPHAQLAPATGRAVKTRTWSVLGFSKLMAQSSSFNAPLMPVAATLQAIRFHVEEPWTLYRDGSEPVSPEDCYLGENPHVVGDLREAGAGAIVGGGCPAYYDGHALVEVGYPWAPEILLVEDGAGGDLLAGTYLYVATWEWRDAAGQLHRSAPGPIYEHVCAGNVSVTIEISTLSLSLRDNAYHYPGCSPINCVLWRTEPGGLVFYRVYAEDGASNSLRYTPENDPFAATIDAFDDVEDANLIQHEALPYQLINGAFTPLPPRQPPASNAIAKWQNRIFLAASQDTRLIYVSQEMLPEPGGTKTLPPEFHPDLAIRVDGLGRVLAMEPRDQEMLALTSSATYSITGEGADGAGQNATYQVGLASANAGTIDARGVISTPAGVFAQTRHGLYCDRGGGQLEHVQLGAKVLDTIRRGGNLRGGVYLPDRGAVRWVTNGAPEGEPLMLELDLQHLRWSISPLQLGVTGSAGLTACVGSSWWLGTNREVLHVVAQAGAVLMERSANDATPYADATPSGVVGVPLRVELAPVHFDGIDGFARVNRWVVAMEKPDASGVRATYYAWRSGRYEDTAGEVWNDASPADERLEIRPREQQCAAAWVEVEEIAPVPTTENIRIVGMHVLVGIKQGLRRA